MASLVTPLGWRRLLTVMESKLPNSVEIYGLLKRSLSGDWPFYNFWVDQWPHVTAVVASPKSEQLDSFGGKFHIIHGEDVGVVTEMLRHPDVIRWSRDMTFDLPPDLFPALNAAAPTERGSLSTLANGRIFTATKETLKTVPAPDDIILDQLTHEAVDIIAKNWRYSAPGMNEFIGRLISTNLPNVCVRTSHENAICAYALTQPHNTIAMVHVEPLFRNQGIEQFMISHLSQQILMTSSIVAANVVDSDPGVESLALNLGFQAQCTFLTAEFTFTPKRKT